MMKKLFCLLLCLLLPIFALAEVDDDTPQLTVTGSASIQLKADAATLNLGVQTAAKEAGEAIRQNAAAMQSLIDALKAAGVAEADLQTAQYSLNAYEQGEYESFGLGGRNYRVSNTLLVTVRDVAAVGSLIDTAVAAGANQVYGISFQSAAAAEAAQQVVKDAVQNAKARAELLASAAGQKLGRLMSISENGASYPMYRTYAAASADSNTATPILSGDMTVSASVTLVYALE